MLEGVWSSQLISGPRWIQHVLPTQLKVEILAFPPAVLISERQKS